MSLSIVRCVQCMYLGLDFYFPSSGLSPASLAIPGAPIPNATDGSAALDVITIHWSAMEFTLSPVMYNVMYTLIGTNGSVDSVSEMVSYLTVYCYVRNLSLADYLAVEFTSDVLWHSLTDLS